MCVCVCDIQNPETKHTMRYDCFQISMSVPSRNRVVRMRSASIKTRPTTVLVEQDSLGMGTPVQVCVCVRVRACYVTLD